MTKEDKIQIRKMINNAKKQHIPAELDLASILLFQQIEAYPKFKEAKTILFYYSLPDEVRTHQFVAKWSQEKEIILPVVKGNELELRRYVNHEQMQKGSYGIGEPIGETWTNYHQIDLAIIPGVSFDYRGNRLGRGKGYYDRLLPQLKAYKIGVCFHFQVTPSIPAEPFDIAMDEIWTEKGMLNKPDSVNSATSGTNKRNNT